MFNRPTLVPGTRLATACLVVVVMMAAFLGQGMARAASAPVVAAISPTSGFVGTTITITGSGFTGATSVSFGTQSAAPNVLNDNSLTVVAPTNPAGVYHLRVQANNGQSPETAADNFRYLDRPSVTSVSPSQGTTAGGTNVVIHGVNLAGAFQVMFGETRTSPYQTSGDTVMVTSPAHGQGTVHVQVLTSGGLSAISSADQYTFVSGAPAVTGISPASGPTSGGTLVTITGSGFFGASAVRFGATAVLSYSVTDTQILAISPAHAAGVVNVSVVTPLGASTGTLADNYTYVSGIPKVLQISPRTGPISGGTVITILGTGFSGATSVGFGSQSIVPNSVTETQIVVVAPAHAAGLVHLLVTTPFGVSPESVLDDYTYGTGQPEILGIAPNHGPSAGGTVVTITGTNLSGTVAVVFGELAVAPSSVTSTQVVATAPAHASGVVHIRVIRPDGASPETALDQYTYDIALPKVLSISPTSGSTVGGTVITITGTGFSGALSVTFGDVAIAPFSVSATQIQVVAPAAAGAGIVHLRVTTPVGVSPETTADNFTYVARPAVTSVSPTFGSTSGGTAIVIRGAGFTGATIVNFGGSGVLPTLVTDSEIRVVSPAHSAGTVHLRIASNGGISPETSNDDFAFIETGPGACPEVPIWVNDLAYGSPGGGFYWDKVSGQVWTAQRGWHLFSPQPARSTDKVLWVNALTYGSPGGGFYWDSVSGQVWTAQRGWHLYDPQGCV